MEVTALPQGPSYKRLLPVFIFLVSLLLLPCLSEASEPAVLSITVNKAAGGEFFVIIADDGDFLIKTADLAKLGLTSPVGTTTSISDEEYMYLRSMEGITYSFDEAALTLDIFAQPDLFSRKTIDFLPPREKNIYYPRDSAVFLNYSLDYYSGPTSDLSTLTNINELGIRNDDYVFLTSTSYTDTSSDDRFARLMTSFVYDNREDLQRFTAGDLITPSRNQGSRLNIGGIGFSKLYKMDPYFIEHPMMNISGHTAIPAEMEIYLDGARIKRESLAPGQFDLNNLFFYGGARDIEVVLRDAFGREQRMRYLFYFDTVLLGKGLHEYSYNAGFTRENYAVESNDYSDLVLSGFHRYGRSDTLTIGARAEGKKDLYNIAPEVSFRIGQYGTATAVLAGSMDDGTTGMSGILDYRYQNRKFTSGLFLTGYTDDYATIAFRASDLDSNYEVGANISFLIQDSSTLSLSASTSDRVRSRAAVNYTRKLSRNVTLFLSAQSVQDNDSNYEFLVGINYYPWRNHTLSARLRQGEDSNAQSLLFQRTPPVGEGYGYWASLERNEFDTATISRFNPALQYNSPFGILRGEYIYEDIDGESSDLYHLTGSGALVYIGKTAGFTRPVRDSFGLVKVGNLEGVDVYSNYQKIGSTGDDGTIIIPEMYSFYDNEIRIDDSDIPMEYFIPVARQVVSPPYRSGTCMLFGLTRFQSYTGTLLMKKEDGLVPVEFYEIELDVEGGKHTFLTGRDGTFYFENIMDQGHDLIPHYREMGCKFLEVSETRSRKIEPGTYNASFTYPGMICSFEVRIPESDLLEVDLGKIICTPMPVPVELPEEPAAEPPAEPEAPSDNLEDLEVIEETPPAEKIAPVEETTPVEDIEPIEEIAPVEETTPAVEPEPIKEQPLIEEPPPAEKPPPPADVSERTETMPLDSSSDISRSKVVQEFVVHFPFKSTFPILEDLPVLLEAADLLRSDPSLFAEIEGYSDNLGPAEYNKYFGLKRARAVQSRLLKLGVNEQQIGDLISYGEERPLCTSNRIACHRKNRRSVIRVFIDGTENHSSFDTAVALLFS